MQGSTVLTQYMNDQLKEDMRRDEQVALGKITQFEADDEAVVWAEVSAKGSQRLMEYCMPFAQGWMRRKTIAEI